MQKKYGHPAIEAIKFFTTGKKTRLRDLWPIQIKLKLPSFCIWDVIPF